MAETVESKERKSRRDILKALGAAAAGTVAGSMLSAKEAEASHGTFNATSSTTDPAIHGDNTNATSGTGVEGTSGAGAGVSGSGQIGVEGFGGNAGVSGQGLTGVEGTGVSVGVKGVGGASGAVGVQGTGDVGVEGTSSSNIGVEGTGPIGVSGLGSTTGVEGTGSVGVLGQGNSIGVHGFSSSGFGVIASTNSGIALQVQGQAKFSTAGSGTILANQASVSVTNSFVTSLSHITVTLTGDPGQAGSTPGFKPVVVWVERQSGTGFVVHMSRPVRVDTPFTFLIVEPV